MFGFQEITLFGNLFLDEFDFQYTSLKPSINDLYSPEENRDLQIISLSAQKLRVERFNLKNPCLYFTDIFGSRIYWKFCQLIVEVCT